MGRIRFAAVVLLALATPVGAGEPAPSDDARVDALLARFARGDAAERAAAATELSALWPAGARGVPLLVAALADEEAQVRTAVTAGLERLGELGARGVARFLSKGGDWDRAAYLSGLEVVLRLGAAVTPTDLAVVVVDWPRAGAVLACLQDLYRDEELGAPYATYALLVQRADRRFVAPSEFKPDEVVETVASSLALRGLSLLPPSPTHPVPAGVGALLADPRFGIRWSGIRLLTRLRSGAAEVVEMLRSAASDTAPEVASAAREALAAVEPAPERAPVPAEAPPGLPDLLQTLDRLGKGAERPTTDHARALRDHGRPAAEGHREPYVLVDLLARVGPEARDALPKLETLARSPNPLLAYLSARAVRKIRPPQGGR